jgi:hypothetical protein
LSGGLHCMAEAAIANYCKYFLIISNIFKFENRKYLQYIKGGLKLQISTIKSKYIVSSRFTDIVNVSAVLVKLWYWQDVRFIKAGFLHIGLIKLYIILTQYAYLEIPKSIAEISRSSYAWVAVAGIMV